MIMTNSHSIQDVLFFPQMKPEVLEQSTEGGDLSETGIREELVPILNKLGHTTASDLSGVTNPNKLFNDVCGMRKKMKLKEVKNPTLEEVTSWIES